MKKVAVLGASGSIGTQTLDVIRMHQDEFSLYAATINSSVQSIEALMQFHPSYIGIRDTSHEKELRPKLKPRGCKLIFGDDAAAICAALPEVDIVVNAVAGFAGLAPLLAAVNAGKLIAAANKESIVCGRALLPIENGRPLTSKLKNGARIIPVDSEQSAIFQCLDCGSEVKQLILTASGGAFRGKTEAELHNILPSDALSHPTWSMGKKITIDSATLFNKGLEVMEASYLFGIDVSHISVLVQPTSIVHSMVEFDDGCIMAQLSNPDMRLPIQYALTEKRRKSSPVSRLDLAALGQLSFEPPKYPFKRALDLAYSCMHNAPHLPIAYNGANEAAVKLFVEGKISFLDIYDKVEYAVEHIEKVSICSLDDILYIDSEARRLTSL